MGARNFFRGAATGSGAIGDAIGGADGAIHAATEACARSIAPRDIDRRVPGRVIAVQGAERAGSGLQRNCASA